MANKTTTEPAAAKPKDGAFFALLALQAATLVRTRDTLTAIAETLDGNDAAEVKAASDECAESSAKLLTVAARHTSKGPLANHAMNAVASAQMQLM